MGWQNELEKASRIWKSLPRNNVDEIKKADEFYDTGVFPIVAEKFKEKYGLERGPVSLLFVTVGTSWQPIALSILCNKPGKVIFLYTEDTRANVTKIIEYLENGLKEYELEEVEKAASGKLIRSVKKWYYREQPGTCCVDITGGTKAMAAAAGMVAEQIGMPVSYIESDYLPVFRHPDPGSERLVSLALPDREDDR